MCIMVLLTMLPRLDCNVPDSHWLSQLSVQLLPQLTTESHPPARGLGHPASRP